MRRIVSFQSREILYPAQIPANPPTAPIRTEAIDSPPAPHSDGIQLPTVDPTTIPIMITTLEFMLVHAATEDRRDS